MSEAVEERAEAPKTDKPTTAEYDDQGEAFARAIEREFRQVMALIEAAERAQERQRAARYRRSVMLVSVSALLIFTLYGTISIENLLYRVAGFLLLAVPFAFVWKTIGKINTEIWQNEKTAAEFAETIREVISTSDWKSKLDPLDWALLRTRLASLELVDLTSTK